MDPENQESFYGVLPEGSKGREADNPNTFKVWSDERHPRRAGQTAIGLFRDKMKGTLTWVAFNCEDTAREAVESKDTSGVNKLASSFRELIAVEVFIRGEAGVEHHVFDEDNSN